MLHLSAYLWYILYILTCIWDIYFYILHKNSFILLHTHTNMYVSHTVLGFLFLQQNTKEQAGKKRIYSTYNSTALFIDEGS